MTKRFYRPELDAIRFLAFALVFLHHSAPASPPSQAGWRVPLTESLAFGLDLFFVLSAYLITTLLLRERAQTGTVSLPLFYKRRVLRIWPLYFLGLGIGLLLDVHFGYFPGNRRWYAAALLMAGNIVLIPASFALHLWSISFEEQFYLVWPSLMKRLSRQGLFVAVVTLTLVSWCATAVFGHLHADTVQRVWFNSLVQMQMFTGGALLALLHDRRGYLLQTFPLRVLVFLCTPALWYVFVRYFSIKGGHAHGAVSLVLGYTAVSITCALIIDALGGATPQIPHWLTYLGRISFGLYVFHAPVLLLGRRYLPLHHSYTLIPVQLVITIAAAAMSYRFFEMPFLRLKSRFEVVKSRPVTG